MILRRSVLGALAFAALALPATSSAAEPGQIVRWPLDSLDGTWPDTTAPAADGDPSWAGHQVDGSIWPDARFGYSYNLAGGVGKGFVVADRPELRPASVTVMAWVRGSRPTNHAVLVAKGAVTHGLGRCEDSAYALTVGEGGAPEFRVGTGDGSEATHVTTTAGGLDPAKVWDGNWHAVAGTFDAATRRVRVALDGHVVGDEVAPRGTIDYGYTQPYPDLTVGRWQNQDACDGAKRQYEGQIDEIRLYDRALSTPELAYLQDPAATTPPALPAPGVPVPDPDPVDPDPGPSDPAPSTPGPSASSPTVTPTAPATTPVPAGPLLPSAVSSSLEAFLPQLGAIRPSADLEALLAQVVLAMREAVQTSNRTEITRSLDERRAAALEASARLQEAAKQAGTALEKGVQLQVQAGPGASSLILATSIAVVDRTAAGKIRTTDIALPTGVYPVDPKTGIATAQVGVSPKAADALRASLGGDVLGVEVLAKPASLPASALPPVEAADLERILAAVRDRMREVDDAAAQLVRSIASTRAHARTASYSSPHGTPATARATTRRQARRAAAKLRRRFRAATHARNVAVRAATRLAVDDYARAGSADATTTSFALKGCTAQGCPFAIGD